VATNTTLGRDGLRSANSLVRETGGLSGAPLRQAASAACRTLYAHVGGTVPIVGVGGIFSADDAYERLRAGASLVQIYTGLIYEGPGLVARILRGLDERLRRDGISNVSEVIGSDVR
jgi:dihydroorotate dehydrogenase